MQEDVYRGDGLNLYAYCANNPVMYFDPSGFASLCLMKYQPGTSPDELRKIDVAIIDQMDGNGGHIQQRHVGKSKEFLLNRAAKDKVDATSFSNKRTAIKAIQENIRKNAAQISNWLNNPEANYPLTIETTHQYPIGYGVKTTNGVMRGNRLHSKASKNVTYDLTSSKVFIVKDSQMPNKYKIITAYPVID